MFNIWNTAKTLERRQVSGITCSSLFKWAVDGKLNRYWCLSPLVSMKLSLRREDLRRCIWYGSLQLLICVLDNYTSWISQVSCSLRANNESQSIFLSTIYFPPVHWSKADNRHNIRRWWKGVSKMLMYHMLSCLTDSLALALYTFFAQRWFYWKALSKLQLFKLNTHWCNTTWELTHIPLLNEIAVQDYLAAWPHSISFGITWCVQASDWPRCSLILVNILSLDSIHGMIALLRQCSIKVQLQEEMGRRPK